jgi:hypothetical protein
MFLEDDMEFCPSGFLAMQYMLSKASRYACPLIGNR